MPEVVICAAVRTPVGGYGGVFRNVPAADLGAAVIRGILDRTGIAPDTVDDVIFGQGYASGEAPAIGRVAALDAGLPVETGGFQVDRRCGSGLQAVINAVMQVQTGADDVIIAGGAESMSQVEYYSAAPRWGVRGEGISFEDRLVRARLRAGGRNYPVPGGMLETAENLRRRYGIPRYEQDRLALTSHRRAVEAQTQGRFADEIVPIRVKDSRGAETMVTRDEHPRADTSLDKLAGLRPIRVEVDPEATVTAGNASGQNDGAAACLVTHVARARELGLTPMARLVAWAHAGVTPSLMGLGPIAATRKAFSRAGLDLRAMDLIELNEAFAAQVLAVTREWGLTDSDFDRLNVNGSGISLGHPIGATGARILATLLHEGRRRGANFVLETMCIGGGQGMAAVFQIL